MRFAKLLLFTVDSTRLFSEEAGDETAFCELGARLFRSELTENVRGYVLLTHTLSKDVIVWQNICSVNSIKIHIFTI